MNKDSLSCDVSKQSSSILVIEPFYGGSHKALVDILTKQFQVELYTLPAKKWHWKARTSALYFAETVRKDHNFSNISFRSLFCSSVLNLVEFAGLRPDFSHVRKVLYFHENQLEYPVRNAKERDFQFGYNQILSCLVADVVLFNSMYNWTSFLQRVPIFLNKIPYYRVKEESLKAINSKCQVLYYPIEFPVLSATVNPHPPEHVLHIVWPHRWEHDKNPVLFFKVLQSLHNEQWPFKVSVLGEFRDEVPAIFDQMKVELADHILHWGFVPSREDYFAVLRSASVAVSTADHEFYGVAMLEAAYLGCFPVCPKRLVYPEIFPEECLYNTEAQLLKMLRNFCKNPKLATTKRRKLKIDFEKYSWSGLESQFRELLLLNESRS